MSQFSFDEECKALAQAPAILPPHFLEPPLFQPKFSKEHPVEPLDLPSLFGKRMERFFSQLLKANHTYELLGENLQVISNGQTLGELDFIIQDKKSKEVLHVEMACKFYLYNKDEGENLLKPWIGPNLKDRLQSKLEKLRQHQFPLLHRPETQELLEKAQIETSGIRQLLYLPGLLFTPVDFKGELPSVNSAALAGNFYHYNELLDRSWESSEFHLPAKKHWLISPAINREWKDFEDIRAELEASLEKKRSPMLWVQHQDGRFERMFVVWW